MTTSAPPSAARPATLARARRRLLALGALFAAAAVISLLRSRKLDAAESAFRARYD